MSKTKFILSSTAFTAVISAYFSFMLNIKFWQFAFERIEISNFTVAIFAMTLPFFIFIPLFWFFSLIVVPYIGKPLIMLLLVLSAASDYALQNLGIVINSDMIRNFAETNLREATDLITLHAVFYVLIVGVIPAVLVYRTEIRFQTPGREIRNRLICFLSAYCRLVPLLPFHIRNMRLSVATISRSVIISIRLTIFMQWVATISGRWMPDESLSSWTMHRGLSPIRNASPGLWS